MRSREKLQALLEELLGTRNVYFQPPSSLTMNYPAIVYKRNSEEVLFANDSIYHNNYGYQITIIDPDPDSAILLKISKLPMCVFNRHYTAENLNHDVYNIYY